jgi:5,10-methylenetetrahydromethanopterin reductase
MHFGVTLLPDNTADDLKYARLADEVGFDLVCIGDSQSKLREAYVSLGAIAGVTSRARIGTMVTNAVTRHPAVTASAVATLQELSRGRAIFGFGSGDSAVTNLGLRGSTVDSMREFIIVMRKLIAGETVQWGGADINVGWSSAPVPFMMSAEGPRTLALAGELCDGVFLGGGLDAVVVADSLNKIAAGARAAGRDPAEVAVWAFAKCSIADTREQAIDLIKMPLAAGANHAFQFSLDGKHVPDELHEPIRRMRREYVANTNPGLIDRLGLTDFLASRFGLIGTPDDIIAQLQALEKAGINRVVFPAYPHVRAEVIRRFGKEVIAVMR